MNAQQLDDEIRLMHARSRRENLRQFLRSAALFGCGGVAGLAGFFLFQSEWAAVGCAIVATLGVTEVQRKPAH